MRRALARLLLTTTATAVPMTMPGPALAEETDDATLLRAFFAADPEARASYEAAARSTHGSTAHQAESERAGGWFGTTRRDLTDVRERVNSSSADSVTHEASSAMSARASRSAYMPR